MNNWGRLNNPSNYHYIGNNRITLCGQTTTPEWELISYNPRAHEFCAICYKRKYPNPKPQQKKNYSQKNCRNLHTAKDKRNPIASIELSQNPDSDANLKLTEQDKKEQAAIVARFNSPGSKPQVTRSTDCWKDGWERTHRRT